MTGVGDDSRGRRWGRPSLVVGLTLAVGATLALVLSDDLRWLRLGIVAALWAALIGAFLAVKYRKHAANSEDAVAEAQAVYELELEREVAARREFELEIEAETRQRADEDSREELDALRNEVLALRDSLQSLFGGEVLYERVALTAQATRMRSLNDDKRLVNGEPKKQPAQLMAPKKIVEVAERPTELIERVLDKAVEQRRPAPAARPKPETPTTSRTAAKPTEPVRRDPAHPQSSPSAKATQAIKVAQATPRNTPVEQPKTERQMPPVKPPKPTLKPAPRPSESSPAFKPVDPPRAPYKPAEPSRPAMKPVAPAPEPTRPALDRVERGRPAASVPPPKPKPAPVAPKVPERPAAASNQEATGEWKPAWETGRRERTATNLSAAFVKREKPVVAEPPRQPEPAKVEINPTLPEAVRELQQSRPGGRRRRAEEEEEAAAVTPEPVSNGRRHRPDGEPPSWQKPAEPVNGSRHGATNGSHSRPEGRNGSHSNGSNGSNGTNGSNGNGHRAAAAHGKEIPEAGSHAAGRSVSELLAAHGANDSAPRRRRRAED
ncbi:DUF6779 domain-containing protein [Amycolatopsis sp. NPDC059657]|uniref:DUF6779 domain-containing protein n=1 Tax=Amycolatopsis sp. NPDC059657 TaxID=3346899 RepID=UPI00367204D7